MITVKIKNYKLNESVGLCNEMPKHFNQVI